MRRPSFVTAREAAEVIGDGDTVCNVSMTMTGTSCAVYDAIEKRFLETGHPRDITLFHTACFSERRVGIERFAHKGLLKKIIGSHWGMAPNIMAMISGGEIEAYNMPLGVISNMFRDISARLPGSLSKVGLGTYLDPRIEGGKMSSACKEDYVELVTVHGEECLLYKAPKIDCLLIRGTYADEDGNISSADEAVMLELLPAALATKRCGGKVIVQVKAVLQGGSIPPKEVVVPGIFVDYVVVCENPERDHRQSASWYQDDSCAGKIRVPVSRMEPAPLNNRKVIVRRATSELKKNSVINAGTGIPNDVIGPILAEEDCADLAMLTLESGTYGGVTVGGVDFGVSKNPVAIVPEDTQFDLYDGVGVDFAFMGAGELDAEGNVNVTKLGRQVPGCGGFVNITSAAKNVIFCATFTGQGLEEEFDENTGLRIIREGSLRKMVKKVGQISYNGKFSTSRGQNALYVTERAVFRLTPEGPVLIEIARGADLQRDVLGQMDFVPAVSPALWETSTAIYRDGPFGLRDMILKKEIL